MSAGAETMTVGRRIDGWGRPMFMQTPKGSREEWGWTCATCGAKAGSHPGVASAWESAQRHAQGHGTPTGRYPSNEETAE